jgi:hypothetical protein
MYFLHFSSDRNTKKSKYLLKILTKKSKKYRTPAENINFFLLIHSVLGKRCKKYAKKILSFCEKVVLLQSQNDGG